METRSEKLLDCMGDDDSLRWKARNQLNRMIERKTAEPGIDVEFCFRNVAGRSVYLMVERDPDEEEPDADILIKGKTGTWELLGCKYRFFPSFVNAYISSIYGCANNATELQTAQELATLFCTPKETVGLGPSALSFHPGGVEITSVKSDVQRDSMAFVSYEEFDSDDIKEVYGMLLRKFAAGEAFDSSKVPKSFFETAFDIARAKQKSKHCKTNG